MPAPRNPNTTKATDQRKANARQRRLDAMASELRGDGEYLVRSRSEVIEMLRKPGYQDGLSAAWLRGYFEISKEEINP